MSVRFFILLAFVVAVLSVALAQAPPASAGGTDPLLAIGQVTARAAGDGSLIKISGSWEFDNLLQVEFPLNVVVSQGTFFVRLPVGGATAVSGTFAGLGDGLDASEIPVLETAGLPDSGAGVVELSNHEIVLYLPASIGNGDVTFVIYVELPAEGGFVSNAVTTTLVGVGS